MLPSLTRLLTARKLAEAGGKGAYDAWSLHRQAVARQQAGHDVLLLTMGSPDSPAPSAAVEVAVAALRNRDTPALWHALPCIVGAR